MGTPFLPNLRFQNLFGQQQPMQADMEMPAFDVAPDISQVPIGYQEPELPQYKPDTRAQDMMWQMMQNFPQRAQPGMLRKIAAVGAGIGYGPQAQDQTLYQPYYQQMQDFSAKFDPLNQIATQERGANTQLRMIADAALRDRAANRRIDVQERDIARKEKEGQQNIAIREKRASTYDWKARNPNMEIEVDKEGRIIGVNPQSGQSQFITGPDGKPVMGNELSAEDKANLQIRVARVRGQISEGIQSRMEDKRQANRMALLERRTALRKEAVTKDKTMSASQEAAAWKLARQQFIADNPNFSHFWDDAGNPSDDASESDDYVDAVDQIRERFNTIKGRVTGKIPTVTPVKPVRSSPNTAPTLPPTPQAGRIIVEKNGQRFSLPANQLQQAISQGYKEVK